MSYGRLVRAQVILAILRKVLFASLENTFLHALRIKGPTGRKSYIQCHEGMAGENMHPICAQVHPERLLGFFAGDV